MTAFVILAAGRGTRMGRVGSDLHKALVPLDDRAILSHILNLRPEGARVIICVGHKAEQIEEYMTLAHPDIDVTWVLDGPVLKGPGMTLSLAKEAVGDDDMLFTTCDTLWQTTDEMPTNRSWVGVHAKPAGTDDVRWCRFASSDTGVVEEIYDKIIGPASNVYIGTAFIHRLHLQQFWDGILHFRIGDEYQVTGGLAALCDMRVLHTNPMTWTDVGDEHAYRIAVKSRSGYDWVKTSQATYVLPETHRVVKYHADPTFIRDRAERGRSLGITIDSRQSMLAYPYAEGITGYEHAQEFGTRTTQLILEWRSRACVRADVTDYNMRSECLAFYQYKTLKRIEQIEDAELHSMASDMVERVDFDDLSKCCIPIVNFHGDLNHGNVIIDDDDYVHAIDWRERFVTTRWGDLRYDLAKLMAGCFVHWDNARRGDFRVWEDAPDHIALIRDACPTEILRDVNIIGALSLLNCAPLHEAPLDEVLVARGCAWLEEIL